MVSERQMKAARALLGWTQGDLAKKIGVVPITIKRAEKDIGSTRISVLEDIEKAFVAAGVEFIADKSKEGATVLLKTKKK
jgi:DNA-binding XRE family transcriptional regulator